MSEVKMGKGKECVEIQNMLEEMDISSIEGSGYQPLGHQDQIANLEETIKELGDEIVMKEKLLTAQKNTSKYLETSQIMLKNKIKSLEDKLKSLEATKSAIPAPSSEPENTVSRKEFEQIKAQAEAKDSEIQNLRSELDSFRDSPTNSAPSAQLSAELEVMRAIVKELSQKVGEQESQALETAEARSGMDRIGTELSKGRRMSEKLELRVRDLEAELVERNSQLQSSVSVNLSGLCEVREPFDIDNMELEDPQIEIFPQNIKIIQQLGNYLTLVGGSKIQALQLIQEWAEQKLQKIYESIQDLD